MIPFLRKVLPLQAGSRLLITAGAFLLTALHGSASGEGFPRVTYAADVKPIMEKHCQTCHRPGEAVPMTLMTYEEIRPWAKAIRKAVLDRSMPPWHADPSVGKFSNERRLANEEVATILNWVGQGAVRGDLPKPEARPAVPTGREWDMGEPDVVLAFPKPIELGPEITDVYRHVYLKTNFTEDRWISASECQPGNPEIVHHIVAIAQPPDLGRIEILGNNIGNYVPGRGAEVIPEGRAILVPAGSVILLQMHYNKPEGISARDQSRIGLRFARHPVRQRQRVGAAWDDSFVIPPGAANHTVRAVTPIEEDIHIHALTPHMHLRGKGMEVWAKLPDGTRRDLLRVPRYDFNWQTVYECEEPVPVPAGSKIHVRAKFDNSKDNPANPDPSAEVRWGLDTPSEMMLAGFTYTVDNEHLDARDPIARSEDPEPPVQE